MTICKQVFDESGDSQGLLSESHSDNVPSHEISATESSDQPQNSKYRYSSDTRKSANTKSSNAGNPAQFLVDDEEEDNLAAGAARDGEIKDGVQMGSEATIRFQNQ